MTALSTLKVKTTDRSTLYYGKFMYRVALRSPNLRYAFNCKTIDDYTNLINLLIDEFDENNAKVRSWRKWVRPCVSEEEYKLIEDILIFVNDTTLHEMYTTRRENTIWTFYTNEIDLVNRLHLLQPTAKITKVRLMPDGVIQFKKDPPAKYRVFLRSTAIDYNLKKEVNTYLEKTPDVIPSNALRKWLNITHKYGGLKCWTWNTHCFDFNDMNNLLMMKLRFPEIIGKHYRLEKKP